ncbi:hypothetical protein [Candidatus Protochlamydia phocaeensis]|uniref:hypothetical protein n=1 Tax=Candidatus Protochlamydia phocaeensis TaxID=1414722 RepID=UPI0008399A2C|nr:hypothetical protein [Candidatus Protochlamydia phocaeensis]
MNFILNLFYSPRVATPRHPSPPSSPSQSEKQLDSFIRALSSQIFSIPPSPLSKPLMPFQVIRYIALNHSPLFYTVALNKIYEPSFHFDQTPEKLTTSCINSTAALSLIFLGEKKAKKIMALLNSDVEYKIDFLLPDKTEWTLRISNLFHSAVIHQINPLNDEKGLKKEQYIRSNPHMHSFIKHIQPLIKPILEKHNSEEIIANLKDCFVNCNYDFNIKTMDSLRKEIKENKAKISGKKSFVYCIGIKEDRAYDHIFIIEQFLCPKTHHMLFRRYQSWIMQATLIEEINKRRNGESGEDAWTEAQLLHFLNNLQNLYCRTGEPITYQDCYGYNRKQDNYTLLKLKTQHNAEDVLYGKSLRYCSCEVDLAHFWENFANFIYSNEELRSQFDVTTRNPLDFSKDDLQAHQSKQNPLDLSPLFDFASLLIG